MGVGDGGWRWGSGRGGVGFTYRYMTLVFRKKGMIMGRGSMGVLEG